MTSGRNQRVQRTILLLTIALTLCLVLAAKSAHAAEQIDQSNLPEWAGGWTHVNPTAEGQAVMWQTFTPACTNLSAVEIVILTVSAGRGDEVLTVEIDKYGDILASADCLVMDGFDGLLRFEFPDAVPLVPEQVYELTVRDTGKTRFGWKYGSDTYERGSRYVFAQERDYTDWFFRTYSKIEPTGAKYGGGTGEPNDPYQIATAEDLMLLGDSPEDYDKHFILTDDIDLDPNLLGRKVFDKAVIAPDVNDANWDFDGIPFTGVFDGNDHTIVNLTINGARYLGLFGRLESAGKLKKLGLVDVNISGYQYVGGLVAENQGNVAECFSTGVVSANYYVGGLVGYNGGGSLIDCYSTSAVSGEYYVGGLAGCNHRQGVVTRCYTIGAVTGTKNYAGGLVGLNEAGVTQCYNSSAVNGKGQVGGLVGENRVTVTHSYSTGAVSGNDCVGGLVGQSRAGTVTQCYSTGAVTGDESVGGLVGDNEADVTQCYSTGAVGGSVNVGGLVGYNDEFGGGTNSSCFWDIETSGHAQSAGGTGLTTAEMQDIQTYINAGWDFVDEINNGTSQVWQVPQQGGYPVLSILSGYIPPQLLGLGTTEAPYLICNALELGSIVYYNPFAHYRLASSIDLSGIRWSTAVVPHFGGTFDANGHAISHLTIAGGSYLGVFGRLAPGAEIIELRVVDVNITGLGACVGGLVGSCGHSDTVGTPQSVIVSRCHSTGIVSGSEVGGLVGSNGGGSVIHQCYSTATVSGATYSSGGLVGGNGGTVTQCYSTGAVSGNGGVGGLVGFNVGTVTHCYSIGAVSTGQYSSVGGLVGMDRAPGGWGGSASGCFWDIQTSGQATSAGGTGKTTAEMKTAATFIDAGWDFVDETANGIEDIWWIDEGQDYPHLWWESSDGASP